MSTSTSIAARAEARPASVALLLAILGVPGVTIAWELPAGGYWIGIPLAVAAVVLGLRARNRSGRRARWVATAAILLGAVEILFTASWIVVSPFDEAAAHAATEGLAGWFGAESAEWPRVRLAKR